jgi:sulfite exporter TauE/SafE
MNEYILVLATGFLGSLHCIGMCGPLVLAYSFNISKSSQKIILFPHFLYNLGRIISYSFAGVVFGLFGKVVFLIIPYHTVKIWLLIVGGILMIIFGLGLLNLIPKLKFSFKVLESKRLKKLFANKLEENSSNSSFIIGLCTIFLPCGLFYPILLKSALSGNMIDGGLNMFFFSLGTVPALFILGLSSYIIGIKVRRISNYLAAGAIILMGILLIYKSFMFDMMHK